MSKYQVNWINAQRAIPVESISLDQIGLRVPVRPHPSEELYLFCASERLSLLARENHDLDFIIECLGQSPYEYYWACRKEDCQHYTCQKIDEKNVLHPLRVVDDEHFTLEQASQMLAQMAIAYPNEIFEILPETPLPARYMEW